MKAATLPRFGSGMITLDTARFSGQTAVSDDLLARLLSAGVGSGTKGGRTGELEACRQRF